MARRGWGLWFLLDAVAQQGLRLLLDPCRRAHLTERTLHHDLQLTVELFVHQSFLHEEARTLLQPLLRLLVLLVAGADPCQRSRSLLMPRVPESESGGAKIRLMMNCRRHPLRLPAQRTKTSTSPLELEGLR